MSKSVHQPQRQQQLHLQYPVNTLLEVTLDVGNEVVTGRVYCTDAVSGVLVLQKALPHTTLTCELRWIQVSSIVRARVLSSPASDTRSDDNSNGGIIHNEPPVQPLHVKLDYKALEDKEKRALNMAREAMLHINMKVSPTGQLVFDRLIKACNDVVWHSNEVSIVVLGQVRVDAPYQVASDCHLIDMGSSGAGVQDANLAQGCLERVQRIVVSTNSATSAAPEQ